MMKFRSIFLVGLFTCGNILPVESFNSTLSNVWNNFKNVINNKNFYYPVTILTGTGIASAILYKNSEIFREKITSIKNKAENIISDDIVIPAVIKWEEIKDEGLTDKEATVLSIASGLLLGSVGYYITSRKS